MENPLGEGRRIARSAEHGGCRLRVGGDGPVAGPVPPVAQAEAAGMRFVTAPRPRRVLAGIVTSPAGIESSPAEIVKKPSKGATSRRVDRQEAKENGEAGDRAPETPF